MQPVTGVLPAAALPRVPAPAIAAAASSALRKGFALVAICNLIAAVAARVTGRAGVLRRIQEAGPEITEAAQESAEQHAAQLKAGVQ